MRTGVDSINSRKSFKQKKTNDKYTCCFDYIENFEEYLNNYGDLMQSRYFEYMEEDLFNSSIDNISIKGSLRKNFSFWKEIGASEFVLDIIKTGYKIPFLESPQSSFSKNNRSAVENSSFVKEAIADLVHKGCVIEVPFKPKVVNPLTVSTNKSGKKRLILDLRIPNKQIWKQKVKFEDWKSALNYFEKGSYLFKFDLKSGYHHFDIFPAMQTYLGFYFEEKFYCYTVLAFGLSSAPYLFTKCLKALLKFWRENSIKIVMFLDDGLGMNKCLEYCNQESKFVKSSLIKAGFLINEEKSIWVPQTVIEWTGIVWNGEEYAISIPDRRISDLFSEIGSILKHLPNSSARKLAKLVGKVISLMPVIGNVARLMTRHLYKLIQNRVSWDRDLFIYDSQVLDEIFFWKESVTSLNKRLLFASVFPENIIFSDASNIAAGAYSVHFCNSVFQAFWSKEEAGKSSTYREIKAVFLALNSYKNLLRNKSVVWYSDSQNCVKIIGSGSFKPELQALATDIYLMCVSFNIHLDMQWIPRSFNEQADLISKSIDYDDWGVSEEFFNFMNQLWGPFDYDRFANHENAKVPRFSSAIWNPGCEVVDAFSQNWAGFNNWLVPPIYLVPKSIRHLVNCEAVGTLIVPKWKSAQFWPLIFDKYSVWSENISDILEFDYDKRIFIQGRNKHALFSSNRFSSKVLAVRFAPRV